jgi:hypothetical protein
MDSILLRPVDCVKQALAERISRREKEILALAPENPNKKADFWLLRERSFFTIWLARYVVEDESFDLKQYNAIQRRVLTGRGEQRGRPKTYANGWSDITYRHALRHWLLNETIAAALKVEFNEPRPVPPVEKPRFPVEVLDLLSKFENLSGYALPNDAYVIYTREDRTILHSGLLPVLETKDWCEEDKKCVKFEEYIRLRKDPVIQQHIQQLLIEEISPEKCPLAA